MNRFAGRIAQGVSLLLAIATLSMAAPLVNSAQATGTVPGAPRGVIPTASGTSVSLTWTAPSSDGGSSVTDYRIQYRDGTAFRSVWTTDPWIDFTHTASISTTATVPGLTVNHIYEFRVAAKNINGQGPWNSRILLAEVTDLFGHSDCAIQQDLSTFCRKYPSSFFDGTTAATRVIEIATNVLGACLLFADGKIKCGGSSNDFGQLGDGTNSRPTGSNLTNVSGIDGSTPAKRAVKVAIGKTHVCALMENGQVQCWGKNADVQLGNGVGRDSSVPTYVGFLTGATPSTTAIDIDAGDNGTCVILQNKTVRCWGKLFSDVLGAVSYFDGSTDATKASSFSGGSGTEGVFGQHGEGPGFCVITVSTQLVCWAANFYGADLVGPRLTNTALNQQAMIPTLVNGLTGVTHVAKSQSAVCVVVTSGSVSCWGTRDRGQLGDGEGSVATGLISIPGLDGSDAASSATSVSVASIRGFCVTREEGDMLCWGLLNSEISYEPAILDRGQFLPVIGGDGGDGGDGGGSGGGGSGGGGSGGGGSGDGGSLPDTPAIPQVVAGDGQVTATVTANVGGVAPAFYVVFAADIAPPGKSCVIMLPSTSMSCVITGLTNGTAYTFKAGACENFVDPCAVPSGATSPVTPSAVSATPPGQPRSVTIATRTAGTLGVTWAAPASPGSSAITGYTVAWREVGKTWVTGNTKSVSVLSASVTALTAGKSYEFRVSATNATLTGAWSASTTGIVPVKAPAPQNVKGIASGLKITLTWSKVTTPSHSPVLKYSMYCAVGLENPARAQVGPTITTATLTVTQRKLYVCRVAAVTAAGRGTDSAPVRVSIK